MSYTLTNPTGVLKEEKTWKLFFQGTGDLFFGVSGHLLPNQTIERNFTLTVTAPNGLLALAYPSEFRDATWDKDDLVWDVTRLLLN